MSDFDLVDLGASELDAESNAITVRARAAAVEGEEAPDFGAAPFMCCLGVAARPAGENENGSAQGIAIKTAGVVGALIGAHDPRAAEVYGEISPGETALFATGEDFDSRVLAKDQMLALVVGNDHVVVVDRKNKQIVINCPGGAIKVSQSDGIVLCDASGNGSLQLKGGIAALLGQVVLAGRQPKFNLANGDKIDGELAKISQAIAALAAGLTTPILPPPYIFTPAASVKAPGIFGG